MPISSPPRKRGRRLGKFDKDGNPVTKFNIRHGKDGIVWMECEGAAATANRKQMKALQEIEKVKALLAGQLRQEMHVPAPSTAVTASPPEAPPPAETNVQATPPDRQSPPPPDGQPG